MSDCPNCAATGFCPVCKGDGLLLAEHVIDTCPECRGYGQVGAEGERTWCRRCGGNGRELMYQQLTPVPGVHRRWELHGLCGRGKRDEERRS